MKEDSLVSESKLSDNLTSYTEMLNRFEWDYKVHRKQEVGKRRKVN